jgi:hypothetical protein
LKDNGTDGVLLCRSRLGAHVDVQVITAHGYVPKPLYVPKGLQSTVDISRRSVTSTSGVTPMI